LYLSILGTKQGFFFSILLYTFVSLKWILPFVSSHNSATLVSQFATLKVIKQEIVNNITKAHLNAKTC